MKFKLFSACLVVATTLAAPALAAEGRTPIYQAGYVVPAAGRYIVTQGLTGNGTDPVITIGGLGVESVDIDLNGFQLTQPPGSTAPVIRMTLTNFNTVHGGLIYGGTRGVEMIDSANSTLEDLTIRGASGAGILVGHQSTIRRVKVLNSGAEGINADNANSVTVEDSLIRFSGADGIRLWSSGRSRVLRTSVNATVGHGISVGGNSYSALIDNCFISDNQLESIYITNNLGAEVWQNVIGGSWLDCIRVTSTARDVSIRENQLTGCGNQPPFVGDGIRIEGAYCSIERNQISSNNDWGLHFSATANQNTYGGNSAMGNQGGGACGGTAYGTEFCDDAAATTNASFGNNLIPTLH